jgi:hypothetical protein
LKVYLEAKRQIEQQYGGIQNYLIKERLEWIPSENGQIIAENDRFLGSNHDVKILFNDFPYGVEDGIVHLVVWSKARIPQNSEGYLDDSSKSVIEDYVVRTFGKGLNMSRDRILWFKNWGALQSVRALEHFHILLRDPPMKQLNVLVSTAGNV